MKKFFAAFVMVMAVLSVFGWGEIRSARMSWEDKVETQERREALLNSFIDAKVEAAKASGNRVSVKVTAMDNRGFTVDMKTMSAGGFRRDLNYRVLWTEVEKEVAAANAETMAALYSM